MNTALPKATLHLILRSIREDGLHPLHAAALHEIGEAQWTALLAADRALALAVGKAEAQWVAATLAALCAPRRRGEDSPNLQALRWMLERRFPEHWGPRKRTSTPPAQVSPSPQTSTSEAPARPEAASTPLEVRFKPSPTPAICGEPYRPAAFRISADLPTHQKRAA